MQGQPPPPPQQLLAPPPMGQPPPPPPPPPPPVGVAPNQAALTPLAQGSFPQQINQANQLSVPHDATSTIFVDGLPFDVTRREISHIFRPFEGYITARLIAKDSVRHPGEKMYIGFIEFDSEVHAYTAMNIVNGYKLDDSTDEGYVMKLTFARSFQRGYNRGGPPGENDKRHPRNLSGRGERGGGRHRRAAQHTYARGEGYRHGDD